MLDNNVNKNQNIAFQTMTPRQNGNQQVPMEAVNPELLKENIQDTYVANRVSETTEDPKAMMYTAGLTLPVWFLSAQAMDRFNAKSRGDYEKSIQYRIGKFGDKISDTVTQSSFGKSSFAQSLNNGYKSFTNFVKTKIIDKSRILSAFAYTPSKPELDMVIGQAEGMPGISLFDYPQHGEKFVKPLNHIEDLDCYGATKAEIDAYKTQFAKLTTPQAQKEFIQNAEKEILQKYTRDPNYAKTLLSNWDSLDFTQKAKKLQDLKAFEWGFKDFADMTKCTEKSAKHMAKILDACLSANKNMMARIWGSEAGTRQHLSKIIFGREVAASETANKLIAGLGNNIFKPEYQEIRDVLEKHHLLDKVPKTSFGRFFSKYLHMTLEGATSRVAGGKLIAVAQAAYFADVLYKSMTAEGGMSEKAKSFAERTTEMLAFFICMPFAIQLMHRIGGLQYAGMTKQQVEAYREALEKFNQKSMSGGFKTKLEYKVAKESLLKQLNAGVRNPFTKLVKRIGRIVSVGLEQIRPWDKKSIGVYKDGKFTYRKGIMEKIKDLFRHPKFGLKQMAGYPMRIVLGMFILLPMFNKIAVKGSHLIFGKPKKSVLDEDKEPEKEVVQNQTQIPPQLMQENQQMKQNPQFTQQVQQPSQIVQNQGQTNLLNKYKNGQNSQTTTKTVTETKDEPVRTYIPSPVGVQLHSMEDATPADEAMRRADLAEQKALETLKMR